MHFKCDDMHSPAVHLELISTGLVHFFVPNCYLTPFWKKNTLLILSSLVPSLVRCFILIQLVLPLRAQAGEVRRSDSARGTTEVGSARVRGEVRRPLGQVLEILKNFLGGKMVVLVKLRGRSFI